jgi:hypothetical protein
VRNVLIQIVRAVIGLYPLRRDAQRVADRNTDALFANVECEYTSML